MQNAWEEVGQLSTTACGLRNGCLGFKGGLDWSEVEGGGAQEHSMWGGGGAFSFQSPEPFEWAFWDYCGLLGNVEEACAQLRCSPLLLGCLAVGRLVCRSVRPLAPHLSFTHRLIGTREEGISFIMFFFFLAGTRLWGGQTKGPLKNPKMNFKMPQLFQCRPLDLTASLWLF